MSLEISPSDQILFKRPLTSESISTLTLTNVNTFPVAFKVKTTAPKQYAVRPNSGVIKAGGSFQVQVLSQAMTTEPPMNMQPKDKFLIQSIMAESDVVGDVFEKSGKQSVERKIRVTYAGDVAKEKEIFREIPSPVVTQPLSANTESETAIPVFQSPLLFKEKKEIKVEKKEAKVEKKEKSPEVQPSVKKEEALVFNTERKDTTSQAKPVVADKEKELLKARIQELEKLLNEKVKESAPQMMMQSGQEGFSVTFVAFAVLIAFLMGSWYF